MTEEDLFEICQLHPGLAESLWLLRTVGFSWEDLKPGLEEYLRQQRKTLN